MGKPQAPEGPSQEWLEKAAAKMAQRFHETYERLAPSYGYVTRQDTREWNPASTNGQLMIAVCLELLTSFVPDA